MAGAVFGEIWVDVGARNIEIFNTKCVSEAREVTSTNGRVRDDEFMLGSCSNHRALDLTLQPFSENFFFA